MLRRRANIAFACPTGSCLFTGGGGGGKGWLALLARADGGQAPGTVPSLAWPQSAGLWLPCGLPGQLTAMTPADGLHFGLAAACLKHSIPGDFNLVRTDEVTALLGESGFDVRR